MSPHGVSRRAPQAVASPSERTRAARLIFATTLAPGVFATLYGPRKVGIMILVMWVLGLTTLLADVVPVWLGVVVLTPVWLSQQYDVRKRTSWGVLARPPTNAEIIGDPPGPGAFAAATDLPADDPRRGWAGR